jgi:large subunit ribosomal protein L29
MKIQELREKTDAELGRLLTELRGGLQEQRFKIASKQLKGVRDVRDAKRTVARILTLQKQRGTSVAKGA